MNQFAGVTTTVEAELHVESATAQILRFDMAEPIDHVKTSRGTLWLDLCLTPRPRDARACYPDRWKQERFEPIGEVFFVPPGECMHARGEKGSQTSIVCQLDRDVMAKWFEADLKWNEGRLDASLHITDRSIRGMLLRLTRELTHPGFASDVLLELMAPQIAIELGRYCAAVADEPTRGGLAAWRLRLIDERVREPGKAPSLSELGRLCNLSVRQLSRGFRISRDCSIGHFIEQTRIDSAKRLLISGKSVKTVAYSMGFSSPSSFSYAFRRATGASPAGYRHKV